MSSGISRPSRNSSHLVGADRKSTRLNSSHGDEFLLVKRKSIIGYPIIIYSIEFSILGNQFVYFDTMKSTKDSLLEDIKAEFAEVNAMMEALEAKEPEDEASEAYDK